MSVDIEKVLSRWSPSKLGMLMRCQNQFYRHYLLGENKPPSIALAFGSAFDLGAGAILSDGVGQGKVGPLSVGQDAFAMAWEWERERIQEWDGEDASSVSSRLEGEGLRLIKHWRDEACNGLVPIASQEHFNVEVEPGLSIEGVLDGRARKDAGSNPQQFVLELKTAGKPWRSRESRSQGKVPSKALQSLQVPAYSIGASVVEGKPVEVVEFHVCARGGKSDVDVIRVPVESAARRGYIQSIKFAQCQARECARTGTFLPTAHLSGHWMCSKKFCGWWRECVKEFGGERAE